METVERDRLVALLEANHRFPGDYHLSVIVLNTDGVFGRVRLALETGLVEPMEEGSWEIRESAQAKYLSYRFRVPVSSADDVLALYERLRGVDGVLTAM